MSDSSLTQRDEIERLADSFMASYRAGCRPSVEKFTKQYPDLADQLRDLLAALLILEQNAPHADHSERPGVSAPLGLAKSREIGDFVIVREVARGGMGVVFEAVQQSLGRRVALKVLSSSGIPHPTQVERFRLEARAASRLHHTHIVPVFGVGEDQGVHFYAMQFIQGQSLDSIITELRGCREVAAPAGRDAHVTKVAIDARVTPACESTDKSSATSAFSSSHGDSQFFRNVARVGQQVAEALSYAHGEGILHRDIKPSNLMIDVKGSAWVTDFGLAKTEDLEGLTRSGDFVGTLRYMAPERLKGRCDRRSNLYGLGATLYELLTLQPFLETTNRGELVDRIHHHEPTRPSKFEPSIPRDLETIVLKAISKDPGGRYPSATMMAEDLGRFLIDRPIKARRITWVEQVLRWCRRNPAVVTLLSLVATLLCVAIAVLAVSNVRIREAQESTRRTLYADDVNLAAHIWESAHGTRRQVTGLLTAHVPKPGEADMREFAWRYQWGRIERGMSSYRCPPQPRGLAIDSEDRLLALDASGTIWIWEGGSLEPKQVNLSPEFEPSLVALSLAGNLVALAEPGIGVHLVEPLGGPRYHLLTIQESLRAIRFSDNGLFLVTIDKSNAAKIWNIPARTLHSELAIEHATLGHVTLAGDGRRLLLAQCPRTAIALYDTTSSSPYQLRGDIFHFFSNQGAISPDGEFVLVGCEGGEISIWNTASTQPQWRLRSGSAARQIQFFPDGKRFLVGSVTGNLSIWDLAAREQLRVLKGQLSSILYMAVSVSGASVASIDGLGALRRWDLALESDARHLRHLGGQIDCCVYSPDGRHLALASMGSGVQIGDVSGAMPFTRLDPATSRRVAFSPDGRLLAAGGSDAKVRIFDVDKGQLRCVLDAPSGEVGYLPGTNWQIPRDVGALQFSQNGRWLAVGYGNTTTLHRDSPSAFQVWSIPDGELLHVFPTNTHISALALSDDGCYLVAAGHNGNVWLCPTTTWDVADVWVSGVGPGCNSVAFSPDGLHLLTGCSGGEIQFWDLKTRRLRRTLHAHGEKVSAMAVSPDRQTLATASWDRTVKLWHIPSYRELTTIPVSDTWVYCVCFSPDGNSLATGGVDTHLRFWDAPAEQATDGQ